MRPKRSKCSRSFRQPGVNQVREPSRASRASRPALPVCSQRAKCEASCPASQVREPPSPPQPARPTVALPPSLLQ
ncbi:hypothetical protein E2C01_019571 [Portunus trituberculatus]|uniref:Uncharacterized protein n=1 Tax=Portunus trituberculatus TaxID=210409 RepID=A0A5B7DXK5_PORTR|nr:hypothetical protein [Portunus trituberculatus]